MKYKIFILSIFTLIFGCNEPSITNPDSEEIKVSLQKMKDNLNPAIFDKSKVIFIDKNNKEVIVKLNKYETKRDEVHNSRTKYSREEFIISYENTELKINSIINGTSQLSYSDDKKTEYTILVYNFGNNYVDEIKNSLDIYYDQSMNKFLPSSFCCNINDTEKLLGKDFSNVIKSKNIQNHNDGLRFSKEIGIISLTDSSGNFYRFDRFE